MGRERGRQRQRAKDDMIQLNAADNVFNRNIHARNHLASP